MKIDSFLLYQWRYLDFNFTEIHVFNAKSSKFHMAFVQIAEVARVTKRVNFRKNVEKSQKP